jgi:hypothetical protein
MQGEANTNIKNASVEGQSSNVAEDVKTVDMSGTNAAGTSNEESPKEFAKKVAEVSGADIPDGVSDPVLHSKDLARKEKAEADKLAASQEAKKGEKKGIRILLSKSHTHEGIEYAEGDEVYVDEDSAKYIELSKAGRRI